MTDIFKTWTDLLAQIDQLAVIISPRTTLNYFS